VLIRIHQREVMVPMNLPLHLYHCCRNCSVAHFHSPISALCVQCTNGS